MIGIITPKFYTNQTPHPKQKSTSFGSNYRAYTIRDLKNPYSYSMMETTTCMFRNDISWKALAKFLNNHFKKTEKVQILNPACSDGSEAYSLIMSLKELNVESAQKFLPIKACDIDEVILQAANSGLVKTTPNDRFSIKENTKDFRKYLTNTNEKLNIINDNLLEDNQNLDLKTFKVTDELKNAVEFKRNDLFNLLKNHKDNANTFLMCRNVLGHLEEYQVKKFADLVHKKLDTRSVIAIGDFDVNHSKIDEYLNELNFKKVLRNIYVKDNKSLLFGDILQNYLNDYRIQSRTSRF